MPTTLTQNKSAKKTTQKKSVSQKKGVNAKRGNTASTAKKPNILSGSNTTRYGR